MNNCTNNIITATAATAATTTATAAINYSDWIATTTTDYATTFGASNVTINTDVFEQYCKPISASFEEKNSDRVFYTVTIDNNPHNWNAVPFDFSIVKIVCEPMIVNINVLVPNKVVEVIVYDGEPHTFKQVCKNGDQFDLKFALALAWAKYNNKHHNLDYSIEGIEYIAQAYIHRFNKSNKEFDRAIKAYNNWLKEEEKKKTEEEERKAIIARRKEKNRKRREKRKAKQNEEQINIIAKAIQMSKED